MAEPLKAGIAPNLVLTNDYVLRFAALDPTTGAPVSGVIVSDATIQTDQEAPAPASKPIPLLPPVLASLPQSGAEAPGLTRA